jgi:maltose O-acetyltransferase
MNYPLRYKGMKIGINSFVHPFCDILFVNFKGIIIGDNVLIGRWSWFSNVGGVDHAIKIGSNCKVGRNFVCHSAKRITIGDGCLISYSVSILDHNHKFIFDKSPVLTGIDDPEEITIGKNTFIGAHSFILKGVTIGENSVVGSNSVVNNSFPSHSIIAGSPARLIGKLSK